MTAGILTAWWVFLILALAVTLIDVCLLGRVVRLSSQISKLTGATGPAAVGIVRNTDAAGALIETVRLIVALKDKTAKLDPLTAAVVRRLRGK
jgi:hypothetical protein